MTGIIDSALMNQSTIFALPLYGETTVTDLIWFVIILILAIIIAKIITLNITRFLKNRVPKNDLNLISKIAYWAIFSIGFLLALPYLNVDLSGLFVAGGVVGIIIGFAAQSVFANFLSGIFLIFEQPMKFGDNVLVDDTLIVVEDIRIFSTIGRTFEGIYVRIPNEKIFTTTITNYVANTARRFEYNIGIRYQDDAARAIEIIKDLIDKEPFCLKNPAPSVYVDQLASDGVIIKTRIWAPSGVWWDVRTTMLWKIKCAIEAEGMQIPLPQRTVWVNSTNEENTPFIPPTVRDKVSPKNLQSGVPFQSEPAKEQSHTSIEYNSSFES
jgi:small-conductance mechanosensitive channel